MFRLFLSKVIHDVLHVFRLGIELFEELEPFVCDGDIYQALVFGTSYFLRPLFCYKAIHNAAGIAHLIEHAAADLQGGQRIAGAAQDAENIELLVRDIFFGKKSFDLFHHPAIGIEQVNHRFLFGAGEGGLVYVFFDAHRAKVKGLRVVISYIHDFGPSSFFSNNLSVFNLSEKK
ncbi:MAG: hypothetical protein JWP69_2055 [Flaviaesturariibacter sp.]|nr:hypothetical protein [Flaviaesturariibacter sp.]